MYDAGRSSNKSRQGEISPKQRVVDAGGGGAAVDGVGGVQRRRPLQRQHRLLHSGAQHQHLRRHQPPRLDLARRHLLQKTLRHRCCSGHDHRPCLHHSRCRLITFFIFLFIQFIYIHIYACALSLLLCY